MLSLNDFISESEDMKEFYERNPSYRPGSKWEDGKFTIVKVNTIGPKENYYMVHFTEEGDSKVHRKPLYIFRSLYKADKVD